MARVSPRRSSSSSSTSSCSRARRSPPPAGRDSASPSVARSSRDTPGGSGPRTPPTAVRSSSVSCPAASPPRPGKSVAAARRVRYHHRFQMIPDVLHLGPIPIHIFGIFLALAFLAASAAASREFARKGYDPALGSSAVVWGAVDDAAVGHGLSLRRGRLGQAGGRGRASDAALRERGVLRRVLLPLAHATGDSARGYGVLVVPPPRLHGPLPGRVRARERTGG